MALKRTEKTATCYMDISILHNPLVRPWPGLDSKIASQIWPEFLIGCLNVTICLSSNKELLYLGVSIHRKNKYCWYR